jgi:hypothetical protein
MRQEMAATELLLTVVNWDVKSLLFTLASFRKACCSSQIV